MTEYRGDWGSRPGAIPRKPEKPECLKDQCRAPLACSGFGYCRELNAGDKITTPDMVEARRRKLARRDV